MGFEKFDINLMNGGGTVESLHCAVQEAVSDIRNMNKPADKKRTVTLTLEFVADDDRANIIVRGGVATKFPAENPTVDMVAIRHDDNQAFINTGEQLPLGYDPVTGEVPSLIKKGKADA